MKRSAVRNFHVPLPDDLYNKVREETGRSGSPATELARCAIEALLEQRQRATQNGAIALYAESSPQRPPIWMKHSRPHP